MSFSGPNVSHSKSLERSFRQLDQVGRNRNISPSENDPKPSNLAFFVANC